MPKLSLFKPEKGNNYKFIDRQISRMFQVGGTDVYLHKYLGPQIATTGTAEQPIYNTVDPTNIQDLLLLENRDRKYEPEVYRIRGIYNVQNIDFNLSQFGLFIDMDTLFMTVHINDFINYIGRKPISGDVVELPHLKDDFALNGLDVSLPRYYVIEDVGRASEGFSATWYPHLYRLKMTKITDSQQFNDILDLPISDDSELTVRDVLSTRAKELEINDAIISQAEIDAPLSGYDTTNFYTLAVDDKTGNPIINTAGNTKQDASMTTYLASEDNAKPLRTGYTGYLVGDGLPVNGYAFGTGIQFPEEAGVDDFFLRKDFIPNRLFRFDGSRWIKVEDDVRMTMTNNDVRHTQKTGFINNTAYTYNNKVGSDILSLMEGVYIIDTNIPSMTSIYVVVKSDTETLEYIVADYPGIITTYTSHNKQKVRITLPIIDTVQQTIPFDGNWTVSLYNYREIQRQSLSKALKPSADL